MKKERINNLLITRETLLVSILKDSFMMSLTILAFWLNYQYLDNNIFLNCFLVLGLLGLWSQTFGTTKHYNATEENLQKIEKILKEEK